MLVASVVCLPVFASVLGLFFAFVSFGPFFFTCIPLSLGFLHQTSAIIFMELRFLDSGLLGGGP